jgi:type II secretory pathway component PulM
MHKIHRTQAKLTQERDLIALVKSLGEEIQEERIGLGRQEAQA